MDEIIRLAEQVNQVYNGEITPDLADDEVNTFFKVAIYHMAYCIAKAPKEQRKKLVDELPKDWATDTKALAKQLVRAVN